MQDSAPAIVENVKFTAQPDGSAAIDVSFNAPDKNIAGNELASIADVKVNRDGTTRFALVSGIMHTFSHLKAVRWTQLVQNLYEMLHRERSLRSRRREYSQIAVWLLTNAQDVFLNIFILPDRIVISMGYVCIPLD